MKSISDLLKFHKVPGIKEAERRRLCAQVLSEVLGVAILPKQVRYTDGSLSLQVAPVIKSALTLKFEEVRATLAVEGVTITEIR